MDANGRSSCVLIIRNKSAEEPGNLEPKPEEPGCETIAHHTPPQPHPVFSCPAQCCTCETCASALKSA